MSSRLLLAGTALCLVGGAGAAPSISNITPANASTAGGVTMTISGSSLGTSTPTVLIGTTPAPVTSWNNTQIQCTIPAGQGTNLDVVVTVLGQPSNAVSFSYNAPSISSISPASAPTSGGTTMTLSGSSFGLTPSVSFDGSPATIISRSHTSIFFRLPAGQGTNKPVSVSVGGQVSNSVSFSYSPPSLSSITPNHGPTSGGTAVTISGTNFGTAAPTVTVGGSNATVTTFSQTSVQIMTPPGEGTGHPVIVTAGGQASNSLSYAYDAPAVANISPSHGAAGTTVTLSGSGFGQNPTVTLGGVAATIVSRTHTQISFLAPAGSGASRPVIVSVAGQSSNSVFFSYDPVITSMTPASGPTAGGTTVVITGNDIATSTPSVTIGGRAAFSVSVLSTTRVQCITPAGEGSDLPVVLTVLGNPSNALSFSYDAPVISSLFAPSKPTAGGTTVTLSGSNFGLNPVVTVDGTLVSVVSRTHTQINFLLPAGQGTGKSIVVTAGGSSSSPFFFSYDPPSLSSISPNHGPTSGGTDVVVTGSNFGKVTPSVLVGGAAATVTTFSQTMVRFTTPAGQGTQTVSITVAGQSSNTVNFTYDAPAIAALSVNHGPTAGGTTTTISGSSFGQSPTVTVGGVPAVVRSSSHTSILITTPAGAGVNRAVRVTVAGQQSNAVSFNYDAPVVTSITPDHATTAGGTLLAISGSNFSTTASATALVTIGGTTATLVTQEETTITVLSPPGTGSRKSVLVTVAGQFNGPNELFSYDHVEEVLPAPSGDAPPTSYTEVRAVIDFNDGSGTNPDGSSDTTVTLVRNNDELENVPGEEVSEVYWQLESDRSFTDATILFQYTEEEVSNLREDLMVLYTSESPDGPWIPVPDQNIDRENNTVTGRVSHFSYFTFAGQPVPVALSGFAVE